MPVAEAVRAALAGTIVNATAVAGLLALSAADAAGLPLRQADAPWPGQPDALLRRQAAQRDTD
jgi:ADP-ribose pyrophosphatase